MPTGFGCRHSFEYHNILLNHSSIHFSWYLRFDLGYIRALSLAYGLVDKSNPLLTASSPHIVLPTVKHDGSSNNQDVPLDLSTTLPSIDDDSHVSIGFLELD